ncbi:MAG TPA: 4Fe-4S binding protein [bacterium]|jgi:pyruvate ferredoxin oxidoreductase delta subunit|nr:4Fe-4S binding protein [bacterium]
MEEKKATWKELPEGDILEGSSSLKFKTGNWRTLKPIHIPEKCIHCLFCWIACPDSAIVVNKETGKFERFNYDYCKGCGICAYECPKDAIKMVNEHGEEK